ncbi:hypothetical protein [Schaalia sp. Marseille-Q2122]|uniref:hypothetical protein n=1 Tax=Schaalia sp. Marseille-Q2122 TaxID=2736604 RepID=UPI00158E5CD5|nr:hypothetical protein [Schaalia sp. Marseille-Q2122]
MGLRTILTLAGVAGAAAIVATGFPKRIGVTRNEAEIVLPGDDILPAASFVTDRAVSIEATPEVVWSVLKNVVQEDDDMSVVIDDENAALVLASAEVAVDEHGTAKDVDATWAFVLIPEDVNRTRLHLRERHQPHCMTAQAACWADATFMSLMTMNILRDIKLLAESGGNAEE